MLKWSIVILALALSAQGVAADLTSAHAACWRVFPNLLGRQVNALPPDDQARKDKCMAIQREWEKSDEAAKQKRADDLNEIEKAPVDVPK